MKYPRYKSHENRDKDVKVNIFYMMGDKVLYTNTC